MFSKYSRVSSNNLVLLFVNVVFSRYLRKNVWPLMGQDRAEESFDRTKVRPWKTEISKDVCGTGSKQSCEQGDVGVTGQFGY